MNKEQFIEKFNLQYVSDEQIIKSIEGEDGANTVDKAFIELMKCVPIEMYKHSFETGSVFYLSVNRVSHKIVSEFYFNEDDMIINTFEFIKLNLDEDFAVKTPFGFKNADQMVEKYNDICFDAFNAKRITKEQMNTFLTNLNGKYFKQIINYGIEIIGAIPEIRFDTYNKGDSGEKDSSSLLF